MAAKLQPAITPDHEDFEPSTEWAREDGCDTLLVFLPGFRKETLKVQITSTPNLRISGERPLGNNRYSRFRKEFPIPSNIDTNEINAKFEGGILYVKHPKIITPAPAQPRERVKPPAEAPMPQKPTSTDQPQKPAAQTPNTQKPTTNEPQKPATETPKPQKPTNDQQQPHKNAAQQVTSMTSKDKIPNAKANGVTNDNKVPQKTPDKEKVAAGNTNGKSSTTSTDANNIVPQKSLEKKKDDGLDEKRKVTSTSDDQKHENIGDSIDKAAKKEKGAAGIISGNGKFTFEDYKTAFGGLVKELKTPRKFMNLVVMVLCVLVLGLYAKNAVRSVGKSKNY